MQTSNRTPQLVRLNPRLSLALPESGRTLDTITRATQTNHEDKHDLIADVVGFVNHIERDLKTVVQNSDETNPR